MTAKSVLVVNPSKPTQVSSAAADTDMGSPAIRPWRTLPLRGFDLRARESNCEWPDSVRCCLTRDLSRSTASGKQVIACCLTLPMPVRISECHPAVKANQNRIALTRGPFVLCAEGVDNGGATQRFFFAKPPKVARRGIVSTKDN